MTTGPWWRSLLVRARGDDGSTLPLVLFYALLSLALIVVVTAASSVYIERKRLLSLADGAALAGAEAFSIADVSRDDAGDDAVVRVALDPARVSTAVRDFVASAPNDRLESLRVEEATSSDGRSATVTLSSYWRPPLVTALIPDGIRIEVTSRARAVFS